MYTDYTVGSYSVRKMVPIGYIYSIVCTIMHVWVVLQKCCSAKNTVGRENFAVKTILRSRPTTKKKKKKYYAARDNVSPGLEPFPVTSPYD